MQFVGDFISKLEATRGETLERPLKIKTDVNITEVEKKDFYAAGDKKEGVVLNFKFEVIYGEDSAKIIIEGGIFTHGDKKEMEDLVKVWGKDKKEAMEKLVPFLNKAMELGYLSAIPVARELRLPTPLRLPRFVPEKEAKEEKNEYVG